MRFSAILASAGLFTGTSVLAGPDMAPAVLPAASSAELQAIESIFNATAKGVDVFGPIPDDAVWDEANGWYTAEEDTKAWAWIRAQSDLPPDSDAGSDIDSDGVERRQQHPPSGLGVSLFPFERCTGAANFIPNVNYNIYYGLRQNMFSVAFSARSMRPNERFHAFRQLPNNLCGQQAFIAQNRPVGCFPQSSHFACFALRV